MNQPVMTYGPIHLLSQKFDMALFIIEKTDFFNTGTRNRFESAKFRYARKVIWLLYIHHVTMNFEKTIGKYKKIRLLNLKKNMKKENFIIFCIVETICYKNNSFLVYYNVSLN